VYGAVAIPDGEPGSNNSRVKMTAKAIIVVFLSDPSVFSSSHPTTHGSTGRREPFGVLGS
jgi:hypothetical protein